MKESPFSIFLLFGEFELFASYYLGISLSDELKSLFPLAFLNIEGPGPLFMDADSDYPHKLQF